MATTTYDLSDCCCFSGGATPTLCDACTAKTTTLYLDYDNPGSSSCTPLSATNALSTLGNGYGSGGTITNNWHSVSPGCFPVGSAIVRACAIGWFFPTVSPCGNSFSLFILDQVTPRAIIFMALAELTTTSGGYWYRRQFYVTNTGYCDLLSNILGTGGSGIGFAPADVCQIVGSGLVFGPSTFFVHP